MLILAVVMHDGHYGKDIGHWDNGSHAYCRKATYNNIFIDHFTPLTTVTLFVEQKW